MKKAGLIRSVERINLGNDMNNRFTLIELLIVVAILGILVSMLLPSLRKSREKAYQAVCGSNSKNIAKALYLYRHNNSDFGIHWLNGGLWENQSGVRYSVNDNSIYPYWGIAIQKYLGEWQTAQELFRCPSTSILDNYPNRSWDKELYENSSYGFNGYFDNPFTSGGTLFQNKENGVYKSQAYSKIDKPATTIYFQDSFEAMLDNNGDCLYNYYQFKGKDQYYLRHMGKSTTTFIDGHVEFKNSFQEELYSGE